MKVLLALIITLLALSAHAKDMLLLRGMVPVTNQIKLDSAKTPYLHTNQKPSQKAPVLTVFQTKNRVLVSIIQR